MRVRFREKQYPVVEMERQWASITVWSIDKSKSEKWENFAQVHYFEVKLPFCLLQSIMCKNRYMFKRSFRDSSGTYIRSRSGGATAKRGQEVSSIDHAITEKQKGVPKKGTDHTNEMGRQGRHMKGRVYCYCIVIFLTCCSPDGLDAYCIRKCVQLEIDISFSEWQVETQSRINHIPFQLSTSLYYHRVRSLPSQPLHLTAHPFEYLHLPSQFWPLLSPLMKMPHILGTCYSQWYPSSLLPSSWSTLCSRDC